VRTQRFPGREQRDDAGERHGRGDDHRWARRLTTGDHHEERRDDHDREQADEPEDRVEDVIVRSTSEGGHTSLVCIARANAASCDAVSRRTSKLLSLALRHEPARFGIALDAAGWTDVDALLAALAAHGVALTRAELERVIAESDKQRFALSPDRARIRASQGHSVAVELGYAPAVPPDALYHGTTTRALAGIRARGIERGSRHHVHLSADTATATKVGGRRGEPIVLVVRAGAMVAAGRVFYRSANGVWLVDHVPVEFVEFPSG
jgi:putative RNA 2'-phosphotransferase